MDFYGFGKILSRLFFKSFYRFKIIGSENIPKDGPVLLCSNHIDNLDPPAIGAFAPRPISFMAKEELFKIPLFSAVLRRLHAFPVKRGMSDREALRTGLKILKDGKVLGLFPEGTRSKDGTLGKGLSGAGFFALRSEATVIPVAIIGPYKPFQKVKIIYGTPIDRIKFHEQKLNAEEVTNLIMNEIQNLIIKYKVVK